MINNALIKQRIYNGKPWFNAPIDELVWEYFCWANGVAQQTYNREYPIQKMRRDFMNSLDHYLPANRGRLFLLFDGATPVGLGGFHSLGEQVAEIKRLYVRPSYRDRGLGQHLLETILAAIAADAFTTARIESAIYMTQARALYEQYDFQETDTYEGAECHGYNDALIYFMERRISPSQP